MEEFGIIVKAGEGVATIFVPLEMVDIIDFVKEGVPHPSKVVKKGNLGFQFGFETDCERSERLSYWRNEFRSGV